jgi:hypothetical protein
MRAVILKSQRLQPPITGQAWQALQLQGDATRSSRDGAAIIGRNERADVVLLALVHRRAQGRGAAGKIAVATGDKRIAAGHGAQGRGSLTEHVVGVI